jgi:hypothetical protein
MPRQSRIDAPGALHHIICRGIEQRPIFRDDRDRDDFVCRLSTLLLETNTPVAVVVNLSQPAVSRSVERGREIAENMGLNLE